MTPPWQYLAWIILGVCFIIPFFILLNKAIKTKPLAMVVLCGVLLVGLWLEHLLLLGPAFDAHVTSLPLAWSDGLISLGFLGTMVLSLGLIFRSYPELVLADSL